MKAQQNGVEFGRKSKLTDEQVEEMRQKRREGVLIKHLVAEYGLSKASVYRLLKATETHNRIFTTLDFFQNLQGDSIYG